jgi:hypothetical protein
MKPDFEYLAHVTLSQWNEEQKKSVPPRTGVNENKKYNPKLNPR